MKEKSKIIIKKLFNYIFEIFVWYLILWICGIVTIYSYIAPKQSALVLFGAVVLTMIPKIHDRFKKTEG